MMTRDQALAAVKVGDIIYGIAAEQKPKLLLVYEADEAGFSARHITSQTIAKFGRDGEAWWTPDGGNCTIVSTAALPPEQYQVAFALDRRMGTKPEYPDSRLTEDEIQLILKHDEFFEQRLLPGTETLVQRAQKLRAIGSILTLDWDPSDAKENPSSLFEYDGYLPELLDLLEKRAAQDDVAHFLADMAARRNRAQIVRERTEDAAASLVQLRESWR